MKKLFILSLVFSVCACSGLRDGFRSRGQEYDDAPTSDRASVYEERGYQDYARGVPEQDVREVYVDAGAPMVVAENDEVLYRDVLFTPRPGARTNPEIVISQEVRDNWNDSITPEVYALLATRATNKMLDDTARIYEKIPAPTLFIKEITKLNEELPAGVFMAARISRQIIEGARTFVVVNNIHDAEYILDISIDRMDVEGYSSPILKYKSVLSDNRNNMIQEWVETIQQVMNDDRSWW